MEDSEKNSSVELIESQIEDRNADKLMYQQFVIQKIKRGIQNLKEGKVVSHKELVEMVEQWKL